MDGYLSFDEVVTDIMLYRMSESSKRLLRAEVDEGADFARILFPLLNERYHLTAPANPHTNEIMPGRFVREALRAIWLRLQ